MTTKERDRSLKLAKAFAKDGEAYFAQLWLKRAQEAGTVSKEEVRKVNGLIAAHGPKHDRSALEEI